MLVKVRGSLASISKSWDSSSLPRTRLIATPTMSQKGHHKMPAARKE